MAFVYYDVGEIVLRVERRQEVGPCRAGALRRRVAEVVLDSQRLVRGDVDAGILGVVRAVRPAKDLSGVGTEDVLKGLERLGAEFVAVADEQRARELSGVGDALEQIDGDEGLASAGSQREQRTLGLVGGLATGNFFHHGADRGVLVVAASAFATGIRLEQRSGGGRLERESHSLFVPGAKVGGRRELGDRSGRRGQAREAVELDKLMSVGREHEADIESLALGVALTLIEAMPGREGFFLGLDERHRDRLRVHVDLDPENVIDLATGSPPRLPVDDLDRARRLLAPNEVFGPATPVYGWIDELGSRIGFVVGHGVLS